VITVAAFSHRCYSDKLLCQSMLDSRCLLNLFVSCLIVMLMLVYFCHTNDRLSCLCSQDVSSMTCLFMIVLLLFSYFIKLMFALVSDDAVLVNSLCYAFARFDNCRLSLLVNLFC
jgi:hypothetical protein